jgi:type II secretory pathway pseudopilin PulG
LELKVNIGMSNFLTTDNCLDRRDWQRQSVTKTERRGQGFVLVEAVVSIAILALTITAFAQYSVIIKRQESAHNRRLIAMRELQNTAQAIRSMPLDRLESVPEIWPLPSTIADQFNEPKLAVRRELGQDTSLKQVRFDLQFTWLEGQVSPGKPIELSIWRFAPK